MKTIYFQTWSNILLYLDQSTNQCVSLRTNSLRTDDTSEAHRSHGDTIIVTRADQTSVKLLDSILQAKYHENSNLSLLYIKANFNMLFGGTHILYMIIHTKQLSWNNYKLN